MLVLSTMYGTNWAEHTLKNLKLLDIKHKYCKSKGSDHLVLCIVVKLLNCMNNKDVNFYSVWSKICMYLVFCDM